MVSKTVKSKLDLKFLKDGEFWMEYKDFIDRFDFVEICHLNRNGLSSQQTNRLKNVWKTANLKGEWKKDSHNSTQILLKIHGNEINKNFTTVVSLMQQSLQRSHNKIEFEIYKATNRTQRYLPGDLIHMTPLHSLGSSPYRKREINIHLKLEPGFYMIIPNIKAEKNMKFLLRVFCDTNITLKKL